ncbi:serine/threonine dehydratase [Gandjariella thermophila]|uniref:threonine ammonia-lyase n=1 Tax=Gandjariella thermophila TaxID=1931992 RepID=A0A4D4J3C7_9PSEU|nr:serine/threonine dehydratase [Gandjariella thermophila]
MLGSFKIRGALHAVHQILPQARHTGVVAFSSGNHGQAVAYAAKVFGVSATVVMPTTAPRTKVDAVRALGATVELVSPEDRDHYPMRLVERTGAAFVHPFDSRAVIAGHASLGRELVEQVPELATVFVPVSGGGLISGVATAVKALRPTARVIGAEPALAGDAAESFRSGRLVRWPEKDTYRTVADGLRAASLGKLPWQHIRSLVDDIVTVTDEEIVDALRQLTVGAKQIVEPSGAVAVAAALHGRVRWSDGGPAVAILSGGNIDPALAADILAR